MKYLFIAFLLLVACDDVGDDDTEPADTDEECGADVYLEICTSEACDSGCAAADTHSGWECVCLCQLERAECIEDMGCPVFGAGECWDDPQTDFCPEDEQDCTEHNPY